MLKLILLFVIDFAVSESCSNYCKFLWDNTTGNATSLNVPRNSSGLGIAGIVTIDGNVFQDPDNPPTTGDLYTQIHFRESMMNNPIFFTFMVKSGTGENVLHVQASYAQTDTLPVFEVTNPFQSNQINLQVSDLNADTQNYYSLFTNRTASLNKCDLGSKASWTSIYSTHNLKLNDTDEIRRTLTGPYSFNYLSVCSNSNPTICPQNLDKPTLGSDFNISCVGSGAPYLTMAWSTDKIVTMTTHPPIYNSSAAEHSISSVLTLPNFSLQHEGDYKCTVTNSNFQTSASQNLTVKYTQPLSVTFLSNDTFSAATITKLHWKVTGWPLNLLKLKCNTSNVVYNTTISTVTPTANFSVSFNTTSDIVACQLTDSQNASVALTTIYRIGMNCSQGEYGSGKECLLCPKGDTSLRGSSVCYHGNSSCGPGLYYGVTSCVACPRNMMSEQGAVKIQECYHVNSTCETGQYAVNSSVCETCEWGTTSDKEAVKIQDCFDPPTKCSANLYYLLNWPCVPCPQGQISLTGAAKIQDCRPANSSCPMNFYGIGNSCSDCTRGKISPPSSVKEEDCKVASSACERGSWGTDSCELCPWGETSDKNTAVKPQDCYSYPAAKTCSAGNYTTTQCVTCPVTCAPCPDNHTSKSGAAKPQDCTEMSSNCTEGYYGYQNRCQLCPDGHTSPASSKTVDQCVSTRLSPQVVFVIGVITVMVMLGLIMVGTFVRFKLKTRRQKRNMRAIFSTRNSGTLIVKNHFAD